MPIKESKSIAIQSVTQIAMRGISYVSILILIPSFISISDANIYADIVLISTIVSLAALFDGGHATSILTLLSKEEMQSSKKTFNSVVRKSLIGSFFWSLFISFVFVIIWVVISPEVNNLIYTAGIVSSCVMLAITATMANTIGRVIITKDFTRGTFFILLVGPFFSMTNVFLLRTFEISSPFFIIASFFLGNLISIIGGLYKCKHMSFKASCVNEQEYLEDRSLRSRRLWLFFSQIVSVLVVAKTPVFIRMLCGNEVLGIFSLFSAVNAVIIAPIAAMQAPLLMKYTYFINSAGYKNKSVYGMIFTHSGIAILFGLIAIPILWVMFSLLNNINIKMVGWGELLIIAISGSIYIVSVVVTIYINAIGETKLMLKMSIAVLIIDTLLIFSMIKSVGAITPMISMSITNGFILLFVLFSNKKRIFR